MAADEAADAPTAAPTRRLAIIGGGMGGISTAYFCDSDWQIDLFEANTKLGGNADTFAIDHQGKSVPSISELSSFTQALTLFIGLFSKRSMPTEPLIPSTIS